MKFFLDIIDIINFYITCILQIYLIFHQTPYKILRTCAIILFTYIYNSYRSRDFWRICSLYIERIMKFTSLRGTDNYSLDKKLLSQLTFRLHPFRPIFDRYRADGTNQSVGTQFRDFTPTVHKILRMQHKIYSAGERKVAHTRRRCSP